MNERRPVALVIALLIAFACGRGKQRAIVTAMHHDLTVMRTAIRDYRQDKGHPPQTLGELVQARYLRTIPKDPVTGTANWRVITEERVYVDDFARKAPAASPAGGIVDVRSAARGTDANGKPWSEY